LALQGGKGLKTAEWGCRGKKGGKGDGVYFTGGSVFL